jgi:hypothetical protein
MADTDYWKKLYQGLWEKTGEREKALAQTIENLTGHKVKIVGLGAGSDEFLSGTAVSHGHEKGDADMTVEGTNINLEVTGPNIHVPRTNPLWVRPDKIKNAKSHFSKKDTWVVHCIERTTIRVIRLDADFFAKYEQGRYSTVNPIIRGARETYVSIPYNDSSVKGFEVLINHIKDWKAQAKG